LPAHTSSTPKLCGKQGKERIQSIYAMTQAMTSQNISVQN